MRFLYNDFSYSDVESISWLAIRRRYSWVAIKESFNTNVLKGMLQESIRLEDSIEGVYVRSDCIV